MPPKLTLVGMPDDGKKPPKGDAPTSLTIFSKPKPDTRSPREVAETLNGLRRPRALTAASRKIPVSNNPFNYRNHQSASWQSEAWAIYDQVGELRYAANLYANGLKRIRLELARKTKDGGPDDAVRLCDLKEKDLTQGDKLIQQVLADFTASQSLTEMQRLWGLNKFVVGEALLVGRPARGRRGRRRKLLDYDWELYSKEDVIHRNGVINLDGEDYDERDLLLVRVWQPHPRRKREADSPVRATLPILRELIGLTMFVSAIIDSRLAGAGVLILPTSATVLGGTAPEDDSEEDPVVAAIIEAMITPIKDRDSAASVVPLILTVPDEAADLVRHMSFASPLDSAAKDLRDEAIRRVALGMDMPPEQLLGMGSSSHWNAWAVQEDTVKLHLIPGVDILADAILDEFLYPVLLELGMPEDEVDSYLFECVADDLISRPNHFEEALELFKVDALTKEALLKAGGFDITDLPEQAKDYDRAVDLALKAVAINPSLLSDPGLPSLVSQFRAVLAGKDASNAPPDAQPASQDRPSEEGETGPMETNTPDPDRANEKRPPKSSPAGPSKA